MLFLALAVAELSRSRKDSLALEEARRLAVLEDAAVRREVALSPEGDVEPGYQAIPVRLAYASPKDRDRARELQKAGTTSCWKLDDECPYVHQVYLVCDPAAPSSEAQAALCEAERTAAEVAEKRGCNGGCHFTDPDEFSLQVGSEAKHGGILEFHAPPADDGTEQPYFDVSMSTWEKACRPVPDAGDDESYRCADPTSGQQRDLFEEEVKAEQGRRGYLTDAERVKICQCDYPSCAAGPQPKCEYSFGALRLLMVRLGQEKTQQPGKPADYYELEGSEILWKMMRA